MKYTWLYILIMLSSILPLEAKSTTYYVSTKGDDQNVGTREKPFRTIQHAADLMQPGQICMIREGRYRETVTLTKSGTREKPLIFMAAPGEEVVIDGTDLITSKWSLASNRIYKTKLSGSTDQLFYKNKVMMLARWPNMIFSENWEDKKKWGRTDKGSERGKIKCKNLAALGKSLKGAKAFLKIGKGNNCFSRDVIVHKPGSSFLQWDDKDFYDNSKLTGEDGDSAKIKSKGLDNNRFFILNHRALLDAEQEWYYDQRKKELLFITPEGQKPQPGEVSIKQRVYGFTGNEIENIVLRNIDFFGCTISFTRVRRLAFQECDFLHPYELHKMQDNKQVSQNEHPIYIQGENCLLQKCLVKYSPGSSIILRGRGNRIENCIVTEGSRHGRHNDPNVTILYDHRPFYKDKEPQSKRWEYSTQEGNFITRSTVYNCSGVGIYLPGKGPGTASYNHVFNVGLYCTDVSALYIPLGRERAWTGYHHNWIHDINGIGMRCDQDGQKVMFHHNVIWNCKAGSKANGYEFKIYNNTIFVDSFMMVKQKQTEVLNDWPIQNNVMFRLIDRMDLKEWKKMTREERKKRKLTIDIPESAVIHNNYLIKKTNQNKFFISTHEDKIDLRLKKDSLLIDKGVHIDGITDGYKGKAPDIGAYEYGAPFWTAGADWWPDGLKAPQSMAEATERAHKILKGQRLYLKGH